jgi:hypothetical protein
MEAAAVVPVEILGAFYAVAIEAQAGGNMPYQIVISEAEAHRCGIKEAIAMWGMPIVHEDLPIGIAHLRTNHGITYDVHLPVRFTED